MLEKTITRDPDPRRLPTIVSSPGDYMTRDGRRVTVFKVTPYPSGDVTAFTVKGSIWREFRGKLRPKGFGIWHPSGRADCLQEKGRDIVGRWEGQ